MLPQPTSDAEQVDRGPAATQLLKQGVLAFKSGDKSQARELIAQAAELAPHNELVWMWTASTARNRAEALDALDRALAINPDNAKAQQWLAKLRPKQKAAPAPSTEPEPEPEAIAKKPVALAAAAAAPESRSAPQHQPEPQADAVVEDRVETPQPTQEEESEPRAAAEPVAEEAQEVEPVAEQATVVESPQGSGTALLPKPLREQAAQPVEGDPLRALLREKAGESTELDAAIAAEAEPERRSAAAIVETESKLETSPETAASARPISTETCLLCGKRSLTDGACGFCQAIADISQLDEISRNESADRTVLLTAIERFRKELDAGPSFEANLGLALAYLNMKQSNDAIPRLGEACRLQPGNAELRQHYERLRSRPLILVVDDSKTVQKMIAGVLEKELYRVSLATDGLQALARLDDETPALILLDITMPRMDGYQVARIITGNDATASIPVVMLSGKDGFFDRMRGKLAGAKGYVTKPFDPADLADTIKRCLDG